MVPSHSKWVGKCSPTVTSEEELEMVNSINDHQSGELVPLFWGWRCEGRTASPQQVELNRL